VEAPFATAPSELGGKGVKTLVPEASKRTEPRVDLLQRCRIDGVEPPRTVGANGGEPGVAQDFQMLGHGWLRDPEFRLDDGGDRARRQLTIGEELEDPTADWVSEDVERVHGEILKG
jgi:hypothetical protein